MTDEPALVTYWDTSAILSVLFRDVHSDRAFRIAARAGIHLMSSLAWTEAHAVIGRIEREARISNAGARDARSQLSGGVWRRIYIEPDWGRAEQLAQAWPLRGADLWHLSAALELREALPELTFISYDSRLREAALGEGLKSAV